MDESMRLSDGRKLEFERIYPLDAAFDTLADVPAGRAREQALQGPGRLHASQGMTERLRQDFGEGGLDIVVHSLANATGGEVAAGGHLAGRATSRR